MGNLILRTSQQYGGLGNEVVATSMNKKSNLRAYPNTSTWNKECQLWNSKKEETAKSSIFKDGFAGEFVKKDDGSAQGEVGMLFRSGMFICGGSRWEILSRRSNHGQESFPWTRN